jgi:hypothetical protein
MQRLWIANVAPGTSDEELKDLVRKYTHDPIECTEIQRVEGDGSRPGALMSFTGKKFDTLGNLSLRLNGLYWKGRRLVCEATVGVG